MGLVGTSARAVFRSTPGALAAVRVMLSRSPSSLNRPHPPHSQAVPDFAAARFIRDIFAVPDLHRPRRSASSSELSSMLFRNMSSSTTTGNSSAAGAHYFTEDASLQLRMTVSAFPSPSHSDPGEGVSFRGLTRVRLRYDLLFCLPSLSEQTRFAPSHVYASLCTSRRPAQNSGPSGSLLLSREEFSSSASCLFIPALSGPPPLRSTALPNHRPDSRVAQALPFMSAPQGTPRSPHPAEKRCGPQQR
jgi:hypothetical protein